MGLRTGSTGERGDRQPNNKERCDTLSEPKIMQE